MTFALALAGAVAGAVSLVLHALAAKYPKLEKYATYADEAEKGVEEVTGQK